MSNLSTLLSDLSDDPVIQGLEVYLVGGAVRDALMGRVVTDRDWVVVGADAQAMTARGFVPVGADFPVFLHPHTQEEFALARTERKTASGHQGFEFYAAQDVTLEQDLQRRDFTVNAIAADPQGRIFDPFGGRADIERKRLRPVGEAFNEDPLRVFRAARFMAQLDFSVDSEFLARLPSMLPELTSLSAERLWQETLKAFSGQPARYFDALNDWGVLQALSLANVETVTVKGTESTSKLADWIFQTPTQSMAWLEAWRAPKRWVQLAKDCAQWESSESAFALLDQMGALKHTPRSELFLDTLAGAGIDATRIRDALEQSLKIKAQDLAGQYQGKALGEALKARREKAYQRSIKSDN